MQIKERIIAYKIMLLRWWFRKVRHAKPTQEGIVLWPYVRKVIRDDYQPQTYIDEIREEQIAKIFEGQNMSRQDQFAALYRALIVVLDEEDLLKEYE